MNTASKILRSNILENITGKEVRDVRHLQVEEGQYLQESPVSSGNMFLFPQILEMVDNGEPYLRGSLHPFTLI